MTAAITIHNY